ncbi:MAG: ATP-binding protein [Deltaproteobacteria bacterium]|nr:ATP-binding protein [Deltaproteobacteria bacterium]MBW1959147.1 ATP-binding protein [Deltaproteobacteria bacterium]MBW2013844.1 ATP-binding protein [Deltaproteobacteria bacterium]MBW2087366.1 ATP-binding protein [Deltaproteobacteria bacterium]MBW2320613.1 ATP-binding protein [Deltaproteobacteria bacterium]
MYIPQKQIENLRQLIIPGKVMVIYGPRRVGKTTLLKKYLESENNSVLFVNGDDIIVRQYLESQSIQTLRDFVGNHRLLVVDEAQYVEKIGLNLKLIVDHIPEIKVIVTGSSSFDLARDVGEPLTGRKYVLKLFPLSQMEISKIEKRHETTASLESRLIYGSYPEVVLIRDNRRREDYLRELIQSYLFKDILALEGIRYANKLVRLLQLLAFQIGKQVSFAELGKQLSMSKNTVERYLDLLEKVFVIYRLSGFSRNLRKEITKSQRYFFYDTGVRNALIGNFNPLAVRNDLGELWENYIITERMKRQEYLRKVTNSYFWRTYDKKEIDLVEEREGRLFGYEVKWKKERVKIPRDWTSGYPDAAFEVIYQENYLKFIQ